MTSSKRRITHIRNASSMLYDPGNNDSFPFNDMVDSIIEGMALNDINSKESNQMKKITKVDQPVSNPGPSSEYTQALKNSEAKFKKLTKTKKFPLMEKTTKVLKQIKHNRKSVPKPRAHMQSAIDSGSEDCPPSPKVSYSERKAEKSKEVKLKPSQRVSSDRNLRVSKKKDQNVSKSKESQCKKNVSKSPPVVNRKEVCEETNPDSGNDSSSSGEFENFIKSMKQSKDRSRKKGSDKIRSIKSIKLKSQAKKIDSSQKKVQDSKSRRAKKSNIAAQSSLKPSKLGKSLDMGLPSIQHREELSTISPDLNVIHNKAIESNVVPENESQTAKESSKDIGNLDQEIKSQTDEESSKDIDNLDQEIESLTDEESSNDGDNSVNDCEISSDSDVQSGSENTDSYAEKLHSHAASVSTDCNSIEFCPSKIATVVSLPSGKDFESDDSDIEIIDVVNAKDSSHRVNLSTADSSLSHEATAYKGTKVLSDFENVASAGVNPLSSSEVDSLSQAKCRTESSDFEKSKSIFVEASNLKAEVAEKYNPVFMTNICQDVAESHSVARPFLQSKNAGTDSDYNDKDSFEQKLVLKHEEMDRNVNSEPDDLIIIEPKSVSQNVKPEPEDDDIVIEYVGKVVPKKETVKSELPQKRKCSPIQNVGDDSSDYPFSAKTLKVCSDKILPSLMEKVLHSALPNSLCLEPSSVMVKEDDDLPELIESYKKETSIYEDIVQSEGHVVASLKKLESIQAEKLTKIRSVILERIQRDPNYKKAFESVEMAETASHSKTAVSKPNSSSESLSPSIKAESNPIDCFAYTSVKTEKRETADGTASSSLVNNPVHIKSEADDNQEIKKEPSLPVQNCAACGKRAVSACKKCAKIFFCSDACGLRVWNESHGNECGQ